MAVPALKPNRAVVAGGGAKSAADFLDNQETPNSGNIKQAEEPQALTAEQMAAQRDRFAALITELDALAKAQMSKKTGVEERWHKDLRQYYGRYAEDVEAKLIVNKKSRLYVNVTKTKTHGWEARLSDMLFPTDDKNWAITSTPIPELTGQAQEEFQQAASLLKQANLQKQAGNDNAALGLAKQAVDPAQRAAGLRQKIKIAKRCAQAMEDTIEDQLLEAGYGVKMRQVIHDACKIGTGIMKGPLGQTRSRPSWKQDATDPKIWRMAHTAVGKQEWRRVDPWNFFPDMDAATPEGWEYTFERHLFTKKDMRRLGKSEGFFADEIAALVQEGPREGLPMYIPKLRLLNSLGNQDSERRYWVWEYYGYLSPDQLETIKILHPGASKVAGDMLSMQLREYPVVIWFAQNRILKFGPHPLDSGDTLYSVFNFDKDETSVFGYGVPYAMRDSQAAVNGAWRMIMDNGNLSTGPQIIINRKLLDPVDGTNAIYGNKLWNRLDVPNPDNRAPMEIIQIQNNQQALMQVIEMAMKFVDDETSMPLIAQGEQAAHITQTKGGMSMLMNSANVVFRRVVKNFDDDMTVPCIRRSFDWNMQFNPNPDIKGDHEVDARGSSALLVREMQAQNLMAIASSWTEHPIIGPMLKVPELIRTTFKANMLAADDLVKTDDELQQQAQQEAANPKPDADMAKLQVQQQIGQAADATKRYVADRTYQAVLVTLATQRNMKLDDLRAMLAKTQAQIESDERQTYADIAGTAQKERMIAGRTGKARTMPMNPKQAVSVPAPSATH